MPSMKVDMGGSAAVLAAFCALVNGGFKEELHCLLCIAENSIRYNFKRRKNPIIFSPDANKPDDVITLLSGKTVEISNTDAEGRLVLADGVYYAKNTLHAKNILDMATLTSAQAVGFNCLRTNFLTFLVCYWSFDFRSFVQQRRSRKGSNVGWKEVWRFSSSGKISWLQLLNVLTTV